MKKYLFVFLVIVGILFISVPVIAQSGTTIGTPVATAQPTEPILCESGGGYTDPQNPDFYAPGIYPDDFGQCPVNYGCKVDVPALGVCVPLSPMVTETQSPCQCADWQTNHEWHEFFGGFVETGYCASKACEEGVVICAPGYYVCNRGCCAIDVGCDK